MKQKKHLFGKPNQQVTDRRTDLQFHCLTEGDSYDLYQIYVKNEWTTCESYEEWLDCGGDWDIFEGDPDMIKINGDVNYFVKIDNHIFYTAERYNEEGMIEGILRSFYSNGSDRYCGYYTKYFNDRPVNESIQNWDAWDAMENGIAYRGGAGYSYEIQHLRDPYGSRPAKHAA